MISKIRDYFNFYGKEETLIKILPNEIILKIFKFIFYKSETYQNLCICNKRCYTILSHNSFWQEIIRKYNPNVKTRELRNKNLKQVVAKNDVAEECLRKNYFFGVLDGYYFNNEKNKRWKRYLCGLNVRLENNKEFYIKYYRIACTSLINNMAYINCFIEVLNYRKAEERLDIESTKFEDVCGIKVKFRELFEIAKKYMQINKKAKAKDLLEKAKNVIFHPEHLKYFIKRRHKMDSFYGMDAFHGLSKCYYETEDIQEAKKILELTEEQFRFFPTLALSVQYSKLAKTYHEITDITKAKFWLTKAYEVSNTKPSAYHVIMVCAFLKYTDIATKFLKDLDIRVFDDKFMRWNDNEKNIFYAIGINIHFGNFKKAISILRPYPFDREKACWKSYAELIRALKAESFEQSIQNLKVFEKYILGYVQLDRLF